MNFPVFSIIIPVYNVEKYLSECIESIVTQNFGSYEVICVNDGSTDNSLSVLIDYQARYSQIKIISQENQGQAAARNSGLAHATGEHVLFIDSDDWIENNALSLLNKIISEDKYDFIHFNVRKYVESENKYSNYYNADVIYEDGIKYYTSNRSGAQGPIFGCVWLRCFRKDFLINNNLSFNSKASPHEDELLILMACYYIRRVRTVPDILYNYRIRQGSDMRNDALKLKRIKAYVECANSLGDFYLPKSGIAKDFIYTYIRSLYIEAFNNLRKWDLRKNETMIKESVNYDNFWKLCTSPKQRFFYLLLRFNPDLYFLYKRLASFAMNKSKSEA